MYGEALEATRRRLMARGGIDPDVENIYEQRLRDKMAELPERRNR